MIIRELITKPFALTVKQILDLKESSIYLDESYQQGTLEESRWGIAEMKRHYSSYFKAIPNFKEYRTQMVTSNSEQEVLEILDKVTKKFSNY